MESSYLVKSILEKHGGAGNLLDASARANFRNGALLLGIGVAVNVIGYLQSGHWYFVAGAVVWGVIFLQRGLRQRRLRDELLRQTRTADSEARLEGTITKS